MWAFFSAMAFCKLHEIMREDVSVTLTFLKYQRLIIYLYNNYKHLSQISICFIGHKNARHVGLYCDIRLSL